MCALLCLALLGQGPTQPISDAAQFLRVMKALHGAIRDVSLTFEGDLDFVGDASRASRKPGDKRQRFQGYFYHRSDGATALDLYEMRGEGVAAPLGRVKTALLRGQLEEQVFNADLGPDPQRDSVAPGGEGALDRPASMHRVLFFWFVRSRDDPSSFELESQGWEEVDGRRCLKVQIAEPPGVEPSKQWSWRMWIDLARGGHPLKVELYDGTSLRRRAHEIRLQQFQLPGGGLAWLPVEGVSESFLIGGGRYDQEPVIRETYSVVKGSVLLNQGLTDRVFSVKWKGPRRESPGMSLLRSEFTRAAARAPGQLLRTDPAGVQEQLDRRLAEADRQAKMLEASSAARGARGWGDLLAPGLALFGVACLLGALYWRMRR